MGYEKIKQPEMRTPGRTIYKLTLDEMKHAATLWLKSKGLSTGGNVLAYPVESRSPNWEQGMNIIVEEVLEPQ